MSKAKLRESARGQDCTLNVAGVCSYDPETVVLCHLDSEFKGVALKSPDHFGVYGCYPCHTWLDQHLGSEEDRLFYCLRGLSRTHSVMFANGVLKVA